MRSNEEAKVADTRTKLCVDFKVYDCLETPRLLGLVLVTLNNAELADEWLGPEHPEWRNRLIPNLLRPWCCRAMNILPQGSCVAGL